MIEHERKILLSKDEYSYLLKKFGQDKPIIKQINYYFDTNDLAMNNQNITCRIRLKDGKYQGTIKQHFPETDHSTETEIDIRNGVYDNTFTDMGLILQGELVTERCVILKNPNIEVVLDKNVYLGHTDYELEIEYLPNYIYDINTTLQKITNILVDHHFSISLKEIMLRCKNAQSKCKRFFERKKINDFNS